MSAVAARRLFTRAKMGNVPPIRRLVKKNAHRILQPARHVLLRRQLRSYRDGSATFDRADASLLIKRWWNGGWTADPDYLVDVADRCREASGPVLECGSGLSTLVAATFARQPVVSLEHVEAWANRVNLRLRQLGLPESVVHAPIRAYDGFNWYSRPLIVPDEAFGLVICDGPPSRTDQVNGRYGVLPVMHDVLAPDCVIMLDDADRVNERNALARWVEEFGCVLLATSGRAAFVGISGSAGR